MKKLLIFIIISVLISLNGLKVLSPKVKAASVYAMVVTENASFFADQSCEIEKFILPIGYYVKVISVGVDFSRVSYMDNALGYPKTEGYVKNVSLNFSKSYSDSPYPNVTLTAIGDEVLFADAEMTKPKVVIPKDKTAVYYGEIYLGGEKCLYVYAEGSVGYVKQSSFSGYVLSPHPDYIKFINEENEKNNLSNSLATKNSNSLSSKDKTTDSKITPTQILILAILFIAAIGIVYLILRPEKSRKKSPSLFSDSDDF